MKIYKDTITHYRRNKLDDHAACGDDLLGRRNEDQLDPFNTTCRNCLISTGRHHSTFQNVDNYYQLMCGWELVVMEDYESSRVPDSFHRVASLVFKDHPTLDYVGLIFNKDWALDNNFHSNAVNSKEESK